MLFVLRRGTYFDFALGSSEFSDKSARSTYVDFSLVLSGFSDKSAFFV
jgi:hypothetical protein